MTALLVIGIILAVLLILNLIPIGARVRYDENGLIVEGVAGLLRVKVYPKPPRPEKEETPAKEPSEKAKRRAAKKAARQAEKERKKKEKKLQVKTEAKSLGVKLDELMPFLKMGLHALGDLRKIFTIRHLTLRVTYGGKDAAETAIHYGTAWMVLSPAMTLLRRAFRVRRSDVQPELNYDSPETRVSADACVTITLGRVFCFAVHYGVKALNLWLDGKKKEKAVQKHESSST